MDNLSETSSDLSQSISLDEIDCNNIPAHSGEPLVSDSNNKK